MESIDIRDFTTVTALDSDNLLLSRADGTAAKVSLAALKTALGEVFAAKAALTAEATHRADVDSALRTDLNGVTRSVEDLVAANEQTQASFAEVRATNTAQDAALASEVTRATTAEAAILATALGTGTENAYDVPMKNVKFMNERELIRRINSDFLSGTEAERGLVRYRYSLTGNNILVLTQGLCESRYATNAQRGCVQMAIGGCKIGTTTTDDQGKDWTEEGITKSVAVNYTGMQILARKLSYDTAGERVITQWTNVLTII